MLSSVDGRQTGDWSETRTLVRRERNPLSSCSFPCSHALVAHLHSSSVDVVVVVAAADSAVGVADFAFVFALLLVAAKDDPGGALEGRHVRHGNPLGGQVRLEHFRGGANRADQRRNSGVALRRRGGRFGSGARGGSGGARRGCGGP